MERPEATDSVYRGDLDKLLRKIREDRGLDLHQYRRAYTERRLAARMRVLTLHTYRQYERYLQDHPEEYNKLLDTLTINVTDFFRDATVYAILRQKVIPQLLEDKLRTRGQRTIRIWSAGCATGEEAYSVTMAFLSALGPRASEFQLSVIATDLDPNALEVGKAATYDISKLQHIPRTEQHWVEKGEHTFKIKPEVARHVKFRRLNLFEDEPINILDVVMCRNVFIYFTREQQARVLESFWSVLHRGGYLVLGRSEKMAPSVAGRFELVSGRERVYRKPYNGGVDRD